SWIGGGWPGRETSKMPSPPRTPPSGGVRGAASRLTSMTSFITRTLCEWMSAGMVISASLRGFAGSLTSTIVVPCGAFMCAMYAVRPLTTTWPPPGQSKYPTGLMPRACAMAASRRVIYVATEVSMNRTRVLLAAAVTMLVIIAAVRLSPVARAADPIKIGLGMALTGGLSANGKPALLAMQIWKDEVNKKGGLLG